MSPMPPYAPQPRDPASSRTMLLVLVMVVVAIVVVYLQRQRGRTGFTGRVEPRAVTVRAPGATGPKAFTVYHYFDGDRPSGEDEAPLAKRVIERADLSRGIELEFPSRGVVFLTTRRGPAGRARPAGP